MAGVGALATRRASHDALAGVAAERARAAPSATGAHDRGLRTGDSERDDGTAGGAPARPVRLGIRLPPARAAARSRGLPRLGCGAARYRRRAAAPRPPLL